MSFVEFRSGSLVSPIINQNESEWRCFMFWYTPRSSTNTIKNIDIVMESSQGRQLLMSVTNIYVMDKQQFVQLPLPQQKRFRVSITKVNFKSNTSAIVVLSENIT